MDVYRNTHTHNYDIDISVDEWKGILNLPRVRNDKNMLLALEKWYLAPTYTASCKSLGKQHGRDFRFFSVQNRRLGQVAARHLNKFRLIGDEDKETYWGIAWIELKKEKGEYTVRLRQELVDAIKSLGLFE